MKGKVLNFFMFVLVLMGTQWKLHAQQTVNREISGVVTDEKGEVLSNASVYIKGTVVGVSAGIDGRYKINVRQQSVDGKEPVLVFTFVGFQNKEVTLGSSNVVNVQLTEEVNSLDEVTAIAYGNRKQRELVTSVASVKADDIKDMPTSNIETLLQGQMSGVQVIQQSGSPGGGGTVVNIRGFNSLLQRVSDPTVTPIGDNTSLPINDGSPLYVIDGVAITSSTNPLTGTNTLADLDPSTIESVEVLKDAASAALYGSRASNGVILITTKQGVDGQGKFTANISYGLSILPETPTQTIGRAERVLQLNMAKNTRQGYFDSSTGTYVFPSSYKDSYNFTNNKGVYDLFWGDLNGPYNPSNLILQDSLNPFYNNSTNWWKYAFGVGKTINANVQTSGGTELIKYMIGTGYYKEDGILVNSNFQRANLTVNLTVKPRKYITIDTRNYLAYTDRSTGKTSGLGVAQMSVSPSTISSLLPGEGDIASAVNSGFADQINLNKSFRIRSNLKATLNLYTGLNFSSSASIDYTQGRINKFSPSYLDQRYGFNKTTGSISANSMFSNENLLTYNIKVNQDHNFDFLLGQSYLDKTFMQYGGWAQNIGSDDVHYASSDVVNPTYIDPATGQSVTMQRYYSTFNESVMLSYFGRVAYNFKQKYLLEATVRRDGSSVFGENVRWATFPSVAAGWNFTEESFMKDAWWLNYGKVRVSWGSSGQQFNQPYLAHGLVSNTQLPFLGNPGLVPEALLSQNLTWEQADQTDVGLDLHFLDHRLKVKTDYYYKYSKSLIYQVPLPGDEYFTNKVWLNAMDMSNQGVELELSYDVLHKSPLTWKTRFNISKNWNRLESSILGTDLYPFVLGRPTFGLYVYQTNGFINTPDDIPTSFTVDGHRNPLYDGSATQPYQIGMRKITDVNGDGRISEKDMIYTGSTLPTASGGWINDFAWKNFTLSILINYTLDRSMINAYRTAGFNFKESSAPLLVDLDEINFYNPSATDNSNANQSAYNNGSYYSTLYTSIIDQNVEQVSYMRLKKLTLGYSLPDTYVKKLKIEKVRFTATVENLFLISNYSGVDPETVPFESGIDQMGSYPLPRTFTVGMNLNF